MERISKDNYYLGIAEAVLKRSTCLKRQYGAVIVKNDEIIATGYNGSPRGELNCCDIYNGKCPRIDVPHNVGNYSDCHSVHAEQNAIISASRRDMIGATLYLAGREHENTYNLIVKNETVKQFQEYTHIKDAAPCPICSRMIKNSGIIRVVNWEGEICLS